MAPYSGGPVQPWTRGHQPAAAQSSYSIEDSADEDSNPFAARPGGFSLEDSADESSPPFAQGAPPSGYRIEDSGELIAPQPPPPASLEESSDFKAFGTSWNLKRQEGSEG